MATSTILGNQWASLTVGDYTVFNNDWGIPGGTPGASTNIQVGDVTDVNHNVTMNWSVPNYIPSTYVWAYPEVYWGGQFGAQLPNFSTTLGNIKSLNVTYSVDATSPDSDVLLEIWTKDASGNLTNEIGVFVYGWGNGETTPYQDQYITALENAHAPGAGGGGGSWNFITLRTTTDKLSGTVSLSNIIGDLIQRGIVNPNDYLSGVELGAEMRKGSGSLHVNSFSVFEELKQTHTITETASSPNQIFDISTNNNYVINGGSGNLVRFEFQQSQYTVTQTASGMVVTDTVTNATVTLNGVSQIAFSDVAPTPVPPTVPPAPPPTVPPTGGSGATVAYSVANDWGSGFIGGLQIRGGASSVDGWTIEFDSAISISNIWGAKIVAHTGNHYTLSNESWDAHVAAGALVDIGFQATPGASGAGVSNLLLNGAPSGSGYTPVTLKLQSSGATATVTNNPTIVGSAESNAIVTITEGSATLGAVTADAGGHWTYTPIGLADGAHNLTATESLAGGNSNAASLAFVLDTAPPPVTAFVQGAAGSTVPTVTSAPTLTGSGDANALVTLTEGGAVLGTTTADAAGVWVYATHNLANGAHSVLAAEKDAAGNVGSAAVSFQLDTPPPVGGSGPTVAYSVANDWGSGFIGNMTVGGGASGVNGWIVNFDAGFDITNMWGAHIVSHSGSHYVAQSESWDANVGAGASVTLGFQASSGAAGSGVSNLLVGAA